jgi:hypothetical protein
MIEHIKEMALYVANSDAQPLPESAYVYLDHCTKQRRLMCLVNVADACVRSQVPEHDCAGRCHRSDRVFVQHKLVQAIRRPPNTCYAWRTIRSITAGNCQDNPCMRTRGTLYITQARMLRENESFNETHACIAARNSCTNTTSRISCSLEAVQHFVEWQRVFKEKFST